ncbi:MAG TPA: hypothetical protein VID04_18030 [Methylomirabilota bacterium]|jgi:hypothetical protein
MTTRALTVAALALLVRPDVAAACATCVASAYGDRTYNWAFLGLVLMPFVLTATVGGIFLHRYGGLRGLFRSPRIDHDPEPSPLASPRVEETT